MKSPGRRFVGILLSAAFVLVACGPGGSPSAAVASATRTATTSAGPSRSGSLPPQTDTDWGRIWDTLPGGFPAYPGAAPGDEAVSGPATAILVVPGAAAKDIATFFQTRLQQTGYKTAGLSGPLEDGGYVLDMTGPIAGCKLQVTATPTGGLTTVTILYGAACPVV